MLKSTAVSGSRLLARQRRRILLPRLEKPHRIFSSAVVMENRSVAPSNYNSNLPSTLIDFQIAAKIEGEESHVATIELRPGETLRAESGAMLFMTEGIVMDTKLNGASSAFSRVLTGQNLFLTDFRYEGTSGTGTLCLGTDFPSKILRFRLEDHPDSTLICQKGAYMASNPDVNIEIEFTKSLTAGFFGGQGFVLQKLTGQGDVLVKGGGTVVKQQLHEGETLRVTSGSIIAFESTIHYDVQMMPGIKSAMFGGEGLFITTLQGPGQLWLQGMPPDRMIAEIARRVPGRVIGLGIPIGMGGGGGAEGAGGAAAADDGATTVPVTDAAVEADRNATVASSGLSSSTDAVDSDSPSALFGDVAPEDATKPGPSSMGIADDSSFADGSTEPTFRSDDSMSSQNSMDSELSFDDEFSTTDEFSGGNTEDGELFDDTTSSVAENVVEEGKSIFRTFWDFFNDEE